MLDQVKSKVEELLSRDEIAGVLGLKQEHKHVQPHLFTDKNELDKLVLDPKYILGKIVKLLQHQEPGIKLGIICRGCDERGLIELAKRNHVKLEDIEIIGLACTEEEAKNCACPKPYPSKIDVGEKVAGDYSKELFEELKSKSLDEKFQFWCGVLSRCMKCYGCRDVCPVCNCDQCMLEKHEWVPGGRLPPDHPTFHLIRAYHVSEKCVGCGECERTCPVDIPLATLQKFIRDDIFEVFEYVAGESASDIPPLISTFEDAPLKEVK